MKLGTRLTLYLSLTIILVLSGYGYFHIKSRHEVLARMMRGEVRGLAETLKFSLEKISLPREMIYIQELLDAVSEPERTLGVIFYHKGKDLIFQSHSLEGEIKAFLEVIKTSIQEDRAIEEFSVFKGAPVFSYTFSIKDKKRKLIGGVSIIQHTAPLEQHLKEASRTILFIILVLIGGTVGLVLLITRRWVSQPISRMVKGIKNLAQGDLDARINLSGRDELSELAQAFNRMAVSLKEAHDRLIQEGQARLELERNLRESEKLATIGQLASGLAHEIGTPLNIISGRAELMRRRLEDKGSLQKNLDVILHQTQRITRIIQQLLGFVRKKRPEQATLNLIDILKPTLDFLDHQIQKQKVRVIKEFREPLPFIRGDSDQLQQVFLNIILNALQAMPQGGTLRLAASAKWMDREGLERYQREYIEILVEDTGVGMDEEVQKNIFQPFFTTKEKEKGTGMGLTVSLGIIQDHEGWVEVASELGKGSVFRIYLPTIESPTQKNQAEAGLGGGGEI